MSLVVTEQAAGALKVMLEQRNPESEQVLRLTYDHENKANLVLGTVKDGDQVVAHQGETVMVIEPLISQDLSGSTLDVKEDAFGMSLALYRQSN
jgi:Fe-S cluster assembly iron-binding protein IscA